MKEFEIGRTDAHAPVALDVARLVDTRLLVQANSGGGKSWLLRLIAERAGIQTIVLDPEGEFASLREKLDMVLVGGDKAELPAEPRSAALLARRLMEFKVSAVIDLYDLKLPDRRRFLKLFLESLMHLGREFWHPALIMLDEAHLYCPEKSSGDAESTDAVIAMMSQGRKRGYCGILSTQRLSKLHKDAAAETNNVVIGRTWLDNDQERAGSLLGMGKADRLALRDLDAGQFVAFGPAFESKGIVRFRSDKVATTHPKPGSRHLMQPPGPSQAIRGVLEKLADLPQQADAEIRDLNSAHAEIARLKRELSAKPKPELHVDPDQLRRAIAQEHRARKSHLHAIALELGKVIRQANTVVAAGEHAISVASEWDGLTAEPPPTITIHAKEPLKPATRAALGEVARAVSNNGATPDPSALTGPQRKILTVLAQAAKPCTKKFVALRAGYAIGGGAFLNPLGALRSCGFITRGDPIEITAEGISALGEYEPLPTGAALGQYWLAHLPGPCAKLLDAIMDAYPKPIDKAELAEATGYVATGGAFLNPLGRLRTLQLIERGQIRASDELFE